MSTWEHLRNAPIVEALIDIRAELPAGATVATFEPLRTLWRDRFPEVRERRKWQTSISLGENQPLAFHADVGTPDGCLFYSPDKTKVVQARLDGFTFSWLRPYDTWEKLRDTARPLWEEFVKTVSPDRVTRIAVRYINRLDLPLPFADFREWILTAPEIAPGIPQQLAGFFLRLHVPYPERNGFVNITQVITTEAHEKVVPMTFDIDAFCPISEPPSRSTIWNRLEDLRVIKNEVFFKSVTPRTLELYR